MGTAPCAPSASGGRRGVLHTGVSRPVACRLGARSPSLRVSPVRSRWQLPHFQEATVENAVVAREGPPRIEGHFDADSKGIASRGLAHSGLEGRPGQPRFFGPRRTSRRGGRQDADPRRSRPRLSPRKRLLPRPRAEAAHLEGQGSFSAFNLDLRPGDGLETYTVTAAQASFNTSYPLPNIRHVAVRFIGAEGARLEIASMRLVTLKEHFVSIPSGVGWHGLSEVFRETVVTRSPESVSFPVDLSSRPWLDVTIGIVDNGPVTFHIAVDAGWSEQGQEAVSPTATSRTSCPSRIGPG